MRRDSVLCLVLFATLVCLPAIAGAGVEEDIIALAKAQWSADMTKDTGNMMATVADDYTEFNADFPTRLDGKALNTRIAEAAAQGSGKVILAEMANPKVQVYGDVAILTYNYIGMMMDDDGETHPNLAKSTRVYAKIGGTWKLVHANFAPVTAPESD
jgi:ketosteroid isomerase-like protein